MLVDRKPSNWVRYCFPTAPLLDSLKDRRRELCSVEMSEWMKRCAKCGQTKPLSEFSRSVSGCDGRVRAAGIARRGLAR